MGRQLRKGKLFRAGSWDQCSAVDYHLVAYHTSHNIFNSVSLFALIHPFVCFLAPFHAGSGGGGEDVDEAIFAAKERRRLEKDRARLQPVMLAGRAAAGAGDAAVTAAAAGMESDNKPSRG